MKAFISYAHNDERALNRLHTHLSMLKREGSLAEWHDKRILAGGRIDDEISSELQSSDIFLALVSPDFLSSTYCEKELQEAIETGLRIVPILVEPCDWKSSPLGAFKGLPKDAMPISQWANENLAYVDIVQELRRIAQEVTIERASASQGLSSKHTAASKPGRYRPKRQFNAIDRQDFLESCYQTIRSYFEESITDLNQTEGLLGRFQDMDYRTFTCTVVNQMIERGEAHITLGHTRGIGNISYVYSASATAGHANGWFAIQSSDYDLFLQPNLSFDGRNSKQMTAPEAAEAVWSEFIGHAGVSHD